MKNKLKLPISYYNYISYSGTLMAAVSFVIFAFLFLIFFAFDLGNSYLGLFLWIIVPAFIVLGLLLIPLGMYFQNKKNKKSGLKPKAAWPSLDLNDKRSRNAVVIFGFGSIIFLLLSAVGSYKAFHYSESVEFCGLLCHDVMKPEYVAYQHSAHAKVACVECHVGSGADWYVRSKLSGLYQVYSVTAGIFPRPIPTPIDNLRPAQETCEECHWPEKFYPRQLLTNKHYLSDDANTEWDINLQMKTGSVLSARGLKEGIHWHINPDTKVEYKASDSSRSHIPWIRYTNLKTGVVKTFIDQNTEHSNEEISEFQKRKMDCLDCHNRPAHNYKTPINFINKAISSGEISKDLPGIKYLAMDILSNTFPTEDSAFTFIAQQVNENYKGSAIADSRPELINQAIQGIQKGFSENIFPEMKVRWSSYPNNLGHLEFNGCFRCHDNQHTTTEGERISQDCNLCHTIIAQGKPDTIQSASIFEAQEFVHPNDEYESWKEGLCSECHRDLY